MQRRNIAKGEGFKKSLIKLAMVMDPLESLAFAKDTSIAMMWEAQDRDYEIYFMLLNDLYYQQGKPYASARKVTVSRDSKNWYSLNQSEKIALSEFNIIMMRKDPPVDRQFNYTTYLLELAELSGSLVVNRPNALRDCNEKMFTTYFPQFTPATLITQSIERLQVFLHEYQDIVVKPLHAMGGTSVFRIKANDVNAKVIFETLTNNASVHIVAQQFIPDIVKGDKRIILIDGEPVPYLLARVPQGDDWRGNLVVGAKGVVQKLSDRDQEICAGIGPELKKRGLYFVGIDVIGDYLTEINVTSPTGVRQLDEGANLNICAQLFDCLESKL